MSNPATIDYAPWRAMLEAEIEDALPGAERWSYVFGWAFAFFLGSLCACFGLGWLPDPPTYIDHAKLATVVPLLVALWAWDRAAARRRRLERALGACAYCAEVLNDEGEEAAELLEKVEVLIDDED